MAVVAAAECRSAQELAALADRCARANWPVPLHPREVRALAALLDRDARTRASSTVVVIAVQAWDLLRAARAPFDADPLFLALGFAMEDLRRTLLLYK